jgi:LysR family nod box-dependent transcriptional activator
MKQSRRVEVVAPSFHLLGGLVVGTHRIATVHRRMAERMAQTAPLLLRELPFSIPPIREGVQWHVASGNDPAINWIVERIQLCAGVAGNASNNVMPFQPTLKMSHGD